MRRGGSGLRCDLRAHGRERRDDPLHGTARERFIAGHFAGEFLPRNDAAQHAHGRTGVAAIERGARERSAPGRFPALRSYRLSAPSLRSHSTPSERMQPSVLAQSAPVE